jgi:hypothetical protein
MKQLAVVITLALTLGALARSPAPAPIYKTSKIAQALEYIRNILESANSHGVRPTSRSEDIGSSSLSGYRLSVLKFEETDNDRFPVLARFSLTNTDGDKRTLEYQLNSKIVTNLMDTL